MSSSTEARSWGLTNLKVHNFSDLSPNRARFFLFCCRTPSATHHRANLHDLRSYHFITNKIKPPSGQKYTLWRGSVAPDLRALPAQSRMDSYTSTTLKESPHATCLLGCIVMKLSSGFGPFRGLENVIKYRASKLGSYEPKSP